MAFQSDHVQSTNLLHYQAHIWNHIFSFVKSMSLKCAIQLHIHDIIDHHGSPMLLSELVEALGMKQERTQFVYRLVRVLVHSGFIIKQNVSSSRGFDEGYLLAPAGRLLLKDHPFSFRPFVLAMLDPIMMDPWQDICKWFQNDDIAPIHTTHGMGLWDLTLQEPRLNQFFNETLASDSRLVISVILEQCKGVFQGLDSIVDVGGRSGTVAKAIANAFPNIRCISFDLPHVVNGLVGTENMTYVGGNMFEAIPNANAVLIKWTLHDWNDEECLKILRNCKKAIPSKENGGKLVIIDMVVRDDEGDNEFLETQLLFDMVMMTYVTGRERSEKDWAKLFLDSGFSGYKITHMLGLRSLIEVYP